MMSWPTAPGACTRRRPGWLWQARCSRPSATKAFENNRFIGLAVNGTGAGRSNKDPCPLCPPPRTPSARFTVRCFVSSSVVGAALTQRRCGALRPCDRKLPPHSVYCGARYAIWASLRRLRGGRWGGGRAHPCPGSVTYSATIESADAPDSGAERSEFAERVLQEATHRGLDRVQRRAILCDQCSLGSGTPPRSCFPPSARSRPVPPQGVS
jgi:hypothetical protein